MPAWAGAVMKVGVVAAKRTLALALMVSLFVGLVPASAAAMSQEDVRDKLYDKINDARRKHDLRPLHRKSTVQKWAQEHARDMARKETMYHDPLLHLEINMLTQWVYWYGENVQFMSNRPAVAKKIHREFMISDDHRANILKPDYTHMGLGVVKRDGVFWVVERFVDLRG